MTKSPQEEKREREDELHCGLCCGLTTMRGIPVNEMNPVTQKRIHATAVSPGVGYRITNLMALQGTSSREVVTLWLQNPSAVLNYMLSPHGQVLSDKIQKQEQSYIVPFFTMFLFFPNYIFLSFKRSLIPQSGRF